MFVNVTVELKVFVTPHLVPCSLPFSYLLRFCFHRESVVQKFKMYGDGTLSQASESQQPSESGSTQETSNEKKKNLISTSSALWGEDPGLQKKVK